MVSEICPKFFNKYKTPVDILSSKEDELSSDLKSIGYQYKKSIILKDISKEILDRFNGEIPSNIDDLCSLKHVGTYIASAYLCFYKGYKEIPIDTNVLRILSRIYKINIYGDNRIDTIVRAILNELNIDGIHKKFFYALLDLGGTVCLPNRPKCEICPIGCKCYYKIVTGI